MRPIYSITAFSALALLMAAPLEAQSLRQQTNGNRAGGPTQIISTNPFLPLFGYFQGEYERRLSANASFALSGSYVDWDDDNRTNIDAKLRLYPQERALEGLGLGASLGFASIQRSGYQDCLFLDSSCTSVPKKSYTSPTFAVEGQYQWLLGAHRATAVTAGFGVKRYFVTKGESRGIDRVLPTGRLTIGYAF